MLPKNFFKIKTLRDIVWVCIYFSTAVICLAKFETIRGIFHYYIFYTSSHGPIHSVCSTHRLMDRFIVYVLIGNGPSGKCRYKIINLIRDQLVTKNDLLAVMLLVSVSYL